MCFGKANESLLKKNISELFLSGKKQGNIKEDVINLSQPIKQKLQQITGHNIEVIPTESIIEQYGQPAYAKCLKSNLRTDFDIMFVYNGEDLKIQRHIQNNSEFLEIIALSTSCLLVKKMIEPHGLNRQLRLSAELARTLMKRTVET